MNIPQLRDLVTRRDQGITISRQRRIKREGSQPFVWIPGAIAASATSVIDPRQQFPASRKYEPLDSIEVVNNETANDLTLTINGNDTYYIPAGTIRSVSGSGVALWHIALTNNGGAVTTQGNIVATIQKQPYTIDKWSRENG